MPLANLPPRHTSDIGRLVAVVLAGYSCAPAMISVCCFCRLRPRSRCNALDNAARSSAAAFSSLARSHNPPITLASADTPLAAFKQTHALTNIWIYPSGASSMSSTSFVSLAAESKPELRARYIQSRVVV